MTIIHYPALGEATRGIRLEGMVFVESKVRLALEEAYFPTKRKTLDDVSMKLLRSLDANYQQLIANIILEKIGTDD